MTLAAAVTAVQLEGQEQAAMATPRASASSHRFSRRRLQLLPPLVHPTLVVGVAVVLMPAPAVAATATAMEAAAAVAVAVAVNKLSSREMVLLLLAFHLCAAPLAFNSSSSSSSMGQGAAEACLALAAPGHRQAMRGLVEAVAVQAMEAAWGQEAVVLAVQEALGAALPLAVLVRCPGRATAWAWGEGEVPNSSSSSQAPHPPPLLLAAEQEGLGLHRG